jgi:hypothetical protein
MRSHYPQWSITKTLRRTLEEIAQAWMHARATT